ncbi:hypothetical protein [Nocardia sp. NPDC051463]|uniref:hypothetical protein n=1 Tax=Nocardia sp. NPDC051463 TaxID=3154845 RepID=UPI00344F93FF
MPDARTNAGARSTIDLLDAFVRGDVKTVHAVLNDCDPAPTIFCLASAWMALVEMQGLNPDQLLGQMRAAARDA